MLDLFPELDELRNRQRSANSRIALDNQAYRMAESLLNASDNGVCQEIGVAGDSFGRQAVRDAIAKAFSSVSIAVAETNPAHAAEKILQLPLSVREAIIESLDFMMTENPVGAGLFLSQRGGKLTVADTVYGGGSASRGQIRIGDRLLGIGTVELLDSFPSDEIGIEAYRLLAGKPGSKVTIRYARSHGEENTCDVVCGGVDALWAYHVLEGVDPDPWRSELRTAIVQCDLKTIRKLARTSLEEQNASGTVATGVATAAGAIQLANALVLFDRSNDSVRFMESVQKRHPGNFWLHQLLGEALVMSNTPPRPEASVRYLTAAVALRPGSAGAHWSMARSLEMLGDFENAREQKKRADELLGRHRSSATTLVTKAGVNDEKSSIVPHTSAQVPLQSLELQCLDLARNGKRVDAMKLIAEKEASGLDGNLCRRAKGMVLAESGDHVGAKVIFTQLVRKNPGDCVSRWFLAQVLHQLGEDSQAIEQCEAALRSNPDFAPAIDLLNILLVR
jgi:eukaryotic-like serine/threonine-protein kinase